jgi:hypothetical protein
MFVHPEQVADLAKRHPEIHRMRLVVDNPRRSGSNGAALRNRGRQRGARQGSAGSLREVTKLRGEVAFCAPGGLANDGKVIEVTSSRRPASPPSCAWRKDADVIFESFRPGVVDKLGIGYAAVKAVNPRVVYCAITGYGQTGPWAELAGHDINYLATSGLLDQIGHHDGQQSGPPAIPNLQVGDLLGVERSLRYLAFSPQ